MRSTFSRNEFTRSDRCAKRVARKKHTIFAFRDFTISCWTFGVVLFANYLAGYTTYQKAWILQRNMSRTPYSSSVSSV